MKSFVKEGEMTIIKHQEIEPDALCLECYQHFIVAFEGFLCPYCGNNDSDLIEIDHLVNSRKPLSIIKEIRRALILLPDENYWWCQYCAYFDIIKEKIPNICPRCWSLCIICSLDQKHSG